MRTLRGHGIGSSKRGGFRPIKYLAHPLRLLALGLTCIFAPQAALVLASEPGQWDVLGDEVDGVPADALLCDYLLGQLRPHYAERQAAIKAITTPQQFEERREKIREVLNRLNGPFPEKTPLKPRVTGRIQRDGYIIEKLIYESRPEHHVTANLYLPVKIDKPIPGVLVPCGHNSNGKGAEPYQRICISLALNGMAALIYDPIGQGERMQLLDASGKSLTAGTSEHTLIGVGGLLVGTGTYNYRIWDGIRSLDYLISRPEVDEKRIGCTGNSGGGTLTSYLMAMDTRIAAAAPSCYLTTFERLFETIGPQDAEQNFPAQVASGLDHADFIHLRAPKPTLMCVATQDYFDNDGAWKTFREAKQLYSLLGHSERMDIVDYNDQHGFSEPRRTAAMRFLRRWLVGADDNPQEAEMTLSTDEELQCTGSGQVLTEFTGISAFDLTRARAEKLESQRNALWDRNVEVALDKVRDLIGFRSSQVVPRVSHKGSVSVTVDAADEDVVGQSSTGLPVELSVQKLVIQRDGEVPLPALLFKPGSPQGHRAPAVIYASPDGQTSSADPDGLCARLAAKGNVVLSVDVRGFGETRDAWRGRKDYFGSDWKTAFLSFHLNRPLLGQRAEDLQTCLNYLTSRDDVDRENVQLIGVAQCGPVALHLAALDSRVRQVRLIRSIESWLEVASEPMAFDQLTNVVPFALEYYDLPNLARSLEPREIFFEQSVDATGKAKARRN